jgi:hypothetical protein
MILVEIIFSFLEIKHYKFREFRVRKKLNLGVFG